MKKTIIYRFAAVAFGAALPVMFGAHAEAAAPANYSRACVEGVASHSVASGGLVEQAAYGTGRRMVRRTARRTSRRHSY